VSVVHGTLGEMVSLVLNGEASLAITIENRPQPAAIVALPFGEIPRVVIVPRDHPLLQEKELTLVAMAASPLVLYDESFSIREEVLQAFRVAGLEPKIAMSAAEAEVIKAYVAHGLGIAVVARTAFDPRSDMLRCLPADHLFPRAVARVLVSRTHFLKTHEYDFIRLCAPSLSPGLVRRQMQKAVSAR
jgi:LysR family cys regulon transcriptional activator